MVFSIASALCMLLIAQQPGSGQETPWGPLPRLDPIPRSSDTALGLELDAILGRITGATRVREHTSHPHRLGLGSDFGFGASPGGVLRASLAGERARGFLQIEFQHASGRGIEGESFHYDEGAFAADVPYRAWANCWFVRVGADFPRAMWEGDGWWIGPRVGIEYAKIDLGLDADDGESSTENYKQFLPYPFVGLAAEWRIGETLVLEAVVDISVVPRVPTFFVEGSRMYMDLQQAFTEVRLKWRVTGGIDLHVGLRYRFWDGHLDSSEDTNDLVLHAPAVLFGATAKF